MTPQLRLTLLLSLLLQTPLPTTSSSNQNSGHYTPIGHGQCISSTNSHYQALRLLKTITEPEYDEFYQAPTSLEGIEHLNSVSKCFTQCSNLHGDPLYVGYEIIVGRGCYCLMDHRVLDGPLGGAMIGDGTGKGEIVGADGRSGHYCYQFVRGTQKQQAAAVNGVAGPTAVVGAGPAPLQFTPVEYTYEPIHLLVGKGQCHDTLGKTYPSILYSTDGSNLACKTHCTLVTPMVHYRGYENYPREKKCGCLFDSSFASKEFYNMPGTGGEGEIRRAKQTEVWKEAFCYKYYKVVKKKRGESVMVTNQVGSGAGEFVVTEAKKDTAMSLPDQAKTTPKKTGPPRPKHISLGPGRCADTNSNMYIGIHHQPKENQHTTYNCETQCLKHSSSKYYRGYEAVRRNEACKCLFDAEAKSDKSLPFYRMEVNEYDGRGEIVKSVRPNDVEECFKYVGRQSTESSSAGAASTSTEPAPEEEAKEEKYTYTLIGEGICTDSKGAWFDAIEYRNVDAMDCQSKCIPFTRHPNYRGIEITLGKYCFCLFDDGTKLDGEQILNYGEGKGEVMGVHKKEGSRGPFCFKYVKLENVDNNEGVEVKEVHEVRVKSGSPASQPSSFEEHESTHEKSTIKPMTSAPPHDYNSIFHPHQTQYDFLRFDPFSFSGAPLGGWGRDTRNRLASLPLRLVNGFEGGWNEVKSVSDDEAEVASDEGEEMEGEVEINPDGSQVARDDSFSNKQSTASKQVESSPSRPPHFIIHDGTGQKYICRIYHDEELVVVSRVDSMFLPATTVAENGGSPGTYEVKEDSKVESDTESDVKTSFNFKMKRDGKSTWQFISNSLDIDVDGNDEESMTEAISNAVASLLQQMGLDDAADLNVQNVGDAEDINAMLTQIGMAAAVGAGVEGANKVAASAGMGSQKSGATKMTVKEIRDALDTLKDFCSQVHLGWWSYEWCHEQEVKQFHVGVSQRGGNQISYEVQDVTLVGHFNGEMEIIYPGGNYATEEDSQGTTMFLKYDSKGTVVSSDIKAHSKEESEHWRSSHHSNELLRHVHKKKNSLDHRGPIIRHIFDSGDMCDEVGYPRQMTVEMRCCTKDEMLSWMNKKYSQGEARHSFTKDKLPKATIVSLKESKTEICRYTSQVCTPALCPPEQTVTTSTANSVPEKKASKNNEAVLNAIGSASEAIASRLAEMLGDTFDVDDIEVYVGDGDNVAMIEELMNDGANPAQMKGLLNQFFNKKGSEKKPPALQMKEGESVRELLDRTLGKRPCLKKNLGWWTYEYCHNTHVLQYHGADLIDTKTGQTFTKKETSHMLGLYEGSGNSLSDYPNEEEHLHVVNATGSSSELDLGRSRPKPRGGNAPNQKSAGGNGAVYVQEWSHGDTCDHEDVAESVIKGGNIVQGSVERSTTVRYSCGKTWELVDINEDSTCHYVIDVSVPELCQHPLFKAPVIKTQVVKCLPV